MVTLHEGLADPSVGMIGAAFSHAQAMAAFWDDETPSNPKNSLETRGRWPNLNVTWRWYPAGGCNHSIFWGDVGQNTQKAPEKGQKGDDEAGESWELALFDQEFRVVSY